MTPPPIILIHRGDSFYLAHTIAQARSSNPDSRLILFGDRSNSFYLGVEHHRYEDYFDEAREFAKLFTYECFPSYQYPWILFCHQKYFALRDFVRAQGIDKFLLIDSDVMIYEQISPYFDHYRNSRMTVSGPPGIRLVHAAFSVVNDRTVLDDLCDCYGRMFAGDIARLRGEHGTNFFYEMVGLYSLSQNPEALVVNTYGTGGKFAISHSVCEDPMYESNGKMVAVYWKDQVPQLREVETGLLRNTPALHFHGKGKYLMGGSLRLHEKRLRFSHLANRTLSVALKYPLRWIRTCGGKPWFPEI